MTPVTLPSGATAVLRDPRQVTERLRKPYASAQRRLAGSDMTVLFRQASAEGRELSEEEQMQVGAHPDADLLGELDYLAIAALVAEWSYPFPVTADSVLDLRVCDLDRLRELCQPLTSQMFVAPVPSPDPASPTPPSAVLPLPSTAVPEGSSQMSGALTSY